MPTSLCNFMQFCCCISLILSLGICWNLSAADIGNLYHCDNVCPSVSAFGFYTFSGKSLKVLLCQPHNSNAIALFHVPCCFPFVYPIFPSLSVVALTHLAQHISIRQRRRRLESEGPDVTQGVEFTNKCVFQKCGNWKKSSGYMHTHVYIYVYI